MQSILTLVVADKRGLDLGIRMQVSVLLSSNVIHIEEGVLFIVGTQHETLAFWYVLLW